MTSKIRLELARTKDRPEGDTRHGYELVAPLDPEGHLDVDAWRHQRAACSVHRFAPGAEDEFGRLVHTRGQRWAFSYRPGDDDDEAVFRLADHRFRVGDYVSITEHDGVTRPFRVVSVRPLPA
jgi:hypothetical protein